MKGIIYEVTYVDGHLALIHGDYYTTKVLHVPTLHAEVNHAGVREENKSYTEKINGKKPVKVGEISISTEDVKIIKACLIAKRQQKKLVEKYLGLVT